ncbi:MAG: hypothetical protein LUD68_09780 [Rikenellaceae bacterium]|nr:hypothetical protein [Rikenellaceae bacterium]
MTFIIGKIEYTASPVKVDRRKLYGWTKLMAVDDNGNPCELLTADESGKYLIPLGGTGIGILSPQGQWVERSELKTVDADGEPAPIFPSSYKTVNTLKTKITPQEFLDYSISDFYQLEDIPQEMLRAVGETIYSFECTYNDSYDPSPAFIMAAQGALFLLIGVKNFYESLCFGDCETIDEDHDDRLVEDGGDFLDFNIF